MEQPTIPCVPADEPGRATHRELLAFMLDDRQDSLTLGLKQSQFRRRQIHTLAAAFGFQHVSTGADEARCVVVYKKGTRPPAGRGKRARPAATEGETASRPEGSPLAVSVSSPNLHNLPQPTRDEVKAQLDAFLADTTRTALNFPTWYSTESRALVHELATPLGLDQLRLAARVLRHHGSHAARQRLVRREGH